jgi:AcrR family transcriptional regulator
MAVSRSRRQAILEAMVRVAGSKGYIETSVADVVNEAGTSRTTFYRNFKDKHDCFLVAYEMATERIVSEIVAACDAERPWLERVRNGLSTVVELFADEPRLGRTVMVEGAVAGAAARRRYWATLSRVTPLLEAGAQPPPGLKPPANAGLMGTSAVAGLIFDELRKGGAGDLIKLLPDLTFAALVPYLGPRRAAGEMHSDATLPPSR